MGDDDPRLEQLEQIYDDHGRLTEPDGQTLLLRRDKDETTWVLMPTRAYVRTRSLHYHTYLTAALGLAVAGCLVHWLIVRPEDLGGYVITTAVIALISALGLKVWNSAMRSGLVVRAGRRIRVSIATVKVLVHPMLHERLGYSLSRDGRFWQIYHIDPAQKRMKFMVSHEAFPTLPEYLQKTVPEALVNMDVTSEKGTP